MHVAVLPVNCIRAENCVYSIDNSNEIFNSDELELERHYARYKGDKELEGLWVFTIVPGTGQFVASGG